MVRSAERASRTMRPQTGLHPSRRHFTAPQDEEGELYEMPWLEPVTLRGPHARLEPLAADQYEGLLEAVKDGDLWKLWYTFIPTAENMRNEIDRRLGFPAGGAMPSFTGFRGQRKN